MEASFLNFWRRKARKNTEDLDYKLNYQNKLIFLKLYRQINIEIVIDIHVCMNVDTYIFPSSACWEGLETTAPLMPRSWF